MYTCTIHNMYSYFNNILYRTRRVLKTMYVSILYLMQCALDVLGHGDVGRVSVFGDEGGAYLRNQHGGGAAEGLLTLCV